MQGTTTLLSPQEMAYVLEIHPYTLNALVDNGTIPHTYIQLPNSNAKQVRFDPYLVLEWFQSEPEIGSLPGKKYLDCLRNQYKTFTPTVQALKNLNSQFAPKRIPKGFSLSKVPSKKYGFLYYVRYIRKGKLVPSRWNTHTNNLKAAEQFARDNREEILNAYDNRHGKTDILRVIETYYEEDSEYLKDAVDLGRNIGEKTRKSYLYFTAKEFIPFLKESGIKSYADITPKTIQKFQVYLLRKGIKPQSINRCSCGIRTALDHLVSCDIISDNVMKKVKWLDDSKTKSRRGCLETDKLHGKFNRKWRDEFSYMLNLVIYGTGLRNAEIESVRLNDIIKIKTCHFFDIKESKTENGVRLVPLHPFIYNRIIEYARKEGLQKEDFIFRQEGCSMDRIYKQATISLGKKLGMTENELKKEGISFYSGRHYWKTVMNEHELGDAEEVFMGHKVNSTIAEHYNHRNKQGMERKLKKAKQVFSILDKTLFRQ